MDLYELAAKQSGVFSLDQAHVHDVSPKSLRTMVDKGTLAKGHPGVFRLVGAPVTWAQHLSAATLWLPGSLASHRSAAALWDSREFQRAPIEIMVERWTRRRRPQGVIVHETKDLVGGDIEERCGIPCTSLIRTLVDLPAVVHEFKAGVALDEASRYDSTVLHRVAQRHQEVARRGRNGTVKLRALLEERGCGEQKVDSGFERRALRLIATSALPAPVTQFQIRDGEFVCYLDLAWPAQKVAMECDSVEHHLSVRAFHWERERRRRLNRLGWTVLEFTYRDITGRPAMVLQELGFHLVP